MVPTARAAALVGACGLLALVLPGAVVALVVVVVLGVTGLDAWRVREPPAASRELPLLLSRGVPEIVNVTLSDPAAEVGQPLPAGLTLTPLRPSGPGRWQADLTAERRGRHLLPPLDVRRTGPLGLGSWGARVGGQATVLVYPDLPAARRLARSIRSSAATVAGQSLRGPLGLGTDFEAVRDYLPDDDVRLVNWRATARHGRPMSNTYRVEQSRHLVLAVDCGRLMVAPLGRLTRLDAAVDAAAAVALAADAAGDRVGLLAFDAVVRAAVRPASGAGTDVLRALAALQPRPVDSDAELVAAALPRGQRATVVVFTDLLDEASARSLLALLAAVAARHAVTVVAAVDDELEAVLRCPPSDAREAARGAAVADLMEARLRTRALLRRAGATVVEAEAPRLAAACVSAYVAGVLLRG